MLTTRVNGVSIAYDVRGSGPTAIPGARLLELPACGHLPMWECPRRLADELLHFLDAAG